MITGITYLKEPVLCQAEGACSVDGISFIQSGRLLYFSLLTERFTFSTNSLVDRIIGLIRVDIACQAFETAYVCIVLTTF